MLQYLRLKRVLLFSSSTYNHPTQRTEAANCPELGVSKLPQAYTVLRGRAKENGFLIQHFPFSSLSYVGHASQSILTSLYHDFMFKVFLHLKRMYKKLGRATKTHKITSSRHQQHVYTAAALSKLERALITKRSASSPQGFSRLRGGFASLLAFQNH